MHTGTMAGNEENLRLAFNCLRPFFPDRDALGTDVFKGDHAKMEQFCGILQHKVKARKIAIQSLKKQLPCGEKQDDDNSSDTCDHDQGHLTPDFVPLHTIVDTLRTSKDAEHVKDGTICLELAPECVLPKVPGKGCTCMRINDGSIKYHEDDERDIARGYGFVNGHALFACDFSTYSSCMQERIKEAVAADLSKEEHAATLAQWLAEALVMRLAFLGMESKGKFLVPERAYAENENCFEASVFFNVCQVCIFFCTAATLGFLMRMPDFDDGRTKNPGLEATRNVLAKMTRGEATTSSSFGSASPRTGGSSSCATRTCTGTAWPRSGAASARAAS